LREDIGSNGEDRRKISVMSRRRASVIEAVEAWRPYAASFSGVVSGSFGNFSIGVWGVDSSGVSSLPCGRGLVSDVVMGEGDVGDGDVGDVVTGDLVGEVVGGVVMGDVVVGKAVGTGDASDFLMTWSFMRVDRAFSCMRRMLVS
jgi:hypothetical protein